jgi:hypothetical protein
MLMSVDDKVKLLNSITMALAVLFIVAAVIFFTYTGALPGYLLGGLAGAAGCYLTTRSSEKNKEKQNGGD